MTDKSKYLQTARKLTQTYIEHFGASFGNIDELDEMIALTLETFLRKTIERIPCDTNWRVNRYNTDDELVLHFWRDVSGHGEQSIDIKVDKQ